MLPLKEIAIQTEFKMMLGGHNLVFDKCDKKY